MKNTGLEGRRSLFLAACVLILIPAWIAAQRRGGNNPFPGGANPDGSLRPTAPLTRLFTRARQEAAEEA